MALLEVRDSSVNRAVPDWWQFTLLALAAYRLLRLASWDEFPLAVKIRAWVIGEHWVAIEDVPAGIEKVEGTGRVDAAELGLPGKQPTSEVAEVRPAYDRPTLAHLVHCPFCAGWWISLAVYGAWVGGQNWTLAAMTPWAISGVVGLVAKNLDA